MKYQTYIPRATTHVSSTQEAQLHNQTTSHKSARANALQVTSHKQPVTVKFNNYRITILVKKDKIQCDFCFSAECVIENVKTCLYDFCVILHNEKTCIYETVFYLYLLVSYLYLLVYVFVFICLQLIIQTKLIIITYLQKKQILIHLLLLYAFDHLKIAMPPVQTLRTGLHEIPTFQSSIVLYQFIVARL